MIQTNCKNFVILKNVLHWHDSCYTVVYGGGGGGGSPWSWKTDLDILWQIVV